MNNHDISLAKRLTKIPPYLFAEIDKIKAKEKEKGKSLVSLGIGDPDLPTPDFVIDRLIRAAKNPANHQYPSYWGMKSFRECVARWYQSRFDVNLSAETDVLSLIGSKEGIAHAPLAFVNPGECVLVPDPGYPVYSASTILADAIPIPFPLSKDRSFLPDFSDLESLIKNAPGRVRMIYLNYPNNPTAATAPPEFFADLVTFAKKHSLIVCHDNAYSEIYFDGKRPMSFLQTPGAKDVGIEFHSVSKTYNMTGWRVGFVVGNSKLIDGLGQVKTNIDSGIFNACQEAAMEALDKGEAFASQMRKTYQLRRDILVPALNQAGLICPSPEATFYLWAQLPPGRSSQEFVIQLIQNKGIVSTPGVGFGRHGEGFVRFTLCSEVPVLKQVAEALN